MLVLIIVLLVGFACLIKGADLFVDGSSGLARLFHVPSLIIGLTIVALGTSAPELAVSVSASIQGANEIALSNVLGSNIFNLLIVLGCCALLYPVPVDRPILKRDFPVSVTATLFLLLSIGIKVFSQGNFFSLNMDQDVAIVTRPIGLILFLAFLLYLFILIKNARKDSDADYEGEGLPLWKCLLYIGIGIAAIIIGGKMVVYSAKGIASAFGMSETLIGLTVVAVGTSLPELVTSLVAAHKQETGLAIGNVLGSNIFNLMFILGISSMLHPVAVNVASVYDLTILLFVSILTWLFAIEKKSVNRLEGLLMVAVYVGILIFAIIR